MPVMYLCDVHVPQMKYLNSYEQHISFFFSSYQSSCSPPFCVLLRRVCRLPADILWVKRQAGALQPLPDFPRQSCLFGGGCVRHAALQCAERDNNKVHKSRPEIKVVAVCSTFICSSAGCCFSSSHHFPLRSGVLAD